MSCQQVHGALFIGIWQIAICSWIMGIAPPPQGVFLMPRFDLVMAIDFSGWLAGSGKLHGMLMGTAVLFFVALFDLAGVQYGLTSLAQLLKNGSVPRSTQIFSSAAISTMVGALLGTSPLIIANESSAGIMEGAKTGLSTIVVGLLFGLSAFISPLLSSIPHLATAAPLVLIGSFMMGPIGGIDWDKLHVALPAFMTITVVPFTYSIHVGIIAGILMDLTLSATAWCRQGCRRDQEAVADIMTPEAMEDPFLRAESPDSSRNGTGRSTPNDMLKRFQSPHSHGLLMTMAESEKHSRVEKLLSELRIAGAQGNLEPKDDLLIQALEDYLELK
jgi:xanthine/uracil/vitamin C permease (AzgA family)